MFKLIEWLRVEPFTLCLSSGYFGLFAHCGMLSVLEEEHLYPIRIHGASAGALVGAYWAADVAMRELQQVLFGLSKDDFWDPGFGLGLLKGERFRRLVKGTCPVKRLEECRIPVSISAFNLLSRTTHVLSEGALADCVYASCAVPFLFQPIRLNGYVYVDGGLMDPAGLAGAEIGERTLHHHVPPRKVWCSRNGGLQRTNTTSVRFVGLAPVGPNRLSNGRVAFEQARSAMRMALNVNVRSGQIVLHV